MADPQNIAIFGGTFDPVHSGHLDVAQKAVAEVGLDQVIFIPCRRSPHKKAAPGASDSQRFQMLQLATAHLAWAEVSDFELKKPPPSYTSETVTHFQKELPPNHRLFLLVGLDQWRKLPTWHRSAELAAKLTFIVVGRSGHPDPQPGYEAVFIEGHHPASASAIRSSLASGQPASWLPDAVAAFIAENRLYAPTP